MREIYEKGTKVMGWRNTGYSKCDTYFVEPFCGEILFHNLYDNVYEIQIDGKMLPRQVNENGVTMFIQEIYDEALRLHKESIICHDRFAKNKRTMRNLLSPVER